MNANLGRLQDGYTSGVRRLAADLVARVARLPITANQVTAAGFALNIAAAVLIFEEMWIVAGIVFLVGSILDIFDGAVARSRGEAGPRGAFIDSTLDRISEAFILGAIGLVFARDGETAALAAVFVALVSSFMTSYARAKAESFGIDGTHGFLARAERVVVLGTALIIFAPLGWLPWAIIAFAALSAGSLAQRTAHVLRQLS